MTSSLFTPIHTRIQQYNQGRDRQLLQRKYERMQSSPFYFLRGTCHLFYEDWSPDTVLNQAPLAWICGDLHLENFGSYKGDDRQVYFDINDFDESILAPCTWDLARLLTSIFIAADTLSITRSQAQDLSQVCLDRYIQELQTGKPRTVDANTSTGMIQDLLEGLQQRKRANFLDKRTEIQAGMRRLKIDNEKVFAVGQEARSHIESLMRSIEAQVAEHVTEHAAEHETEDTTEHTTEHTTETWAAFQDEPQFFRLLDVAERVAGTSSLGLKRYLLLVEGKGSPDRNYLLDLKQARASALQPYVSLHSPVMQPNWSDQATRSVAIETRIQAIPPALLHPLMLAGQPFVLRELQPSQDKLSLELWQGKFKRLETVVETMGAISAWGQLRSSGREGSAIADDLIAFAQESDWRKPLLDYAQSYADQVEQDYAEFCQVSPLDLL